VILNSIGADIGVIVIRCLEEKEQYKIVSRLYSGSYAVQTVGDTARYNRVRVFATLSQKEVMDDLEVDAEEISVFWNNTSYVGIIREPISWSVFHAGVSYYGEFDLLVKGA
jgi:hypothetical protein